MDVTGLTGNELVFDNVFVGAAANTQTLTAGDRPDGALERPNFASGTPASNIRAGASTRQATGTSVTMSWTLAVANS